MRLLPLTNCGACGFRTCMALAGAVSRRKAVLSTCRHFPEPVDAKLLFVVKGRRSETIRKIEVDADLAGVAISKINNASQSVSEACAELNDKTKPSKALTGNHAGIVSPLSRREAEVLRLISGGLTNKEIAWRLKITPDTVKSHVVHIFNKLGVNDRTQAAVRAVQNQLI
ncbi:MAG: hypothetical protein JXR89_07710 [Deltaproteobacteria bacterium]|nr:hypothetical protein [Deltaproteobacteria bacterium]